ncbi:MAG: DUF4175 domain-containing protein, partial [Planctomycetota bacterium]
MNEHTQLIRRLSRIRAAARRRMVTYGVCAVLAGGVVALLTIVTLDWMLDFPPLLRLCAAAAFLIGFVWAVMRWIVKPLIVPLTLEEVAARIERRFPGLKDRLRSAVCFLEQGGDGSPALTESVIAETHRQAAGLPLESVLSLRPMVVRGLWLVAG